MDYPKVKVCLDTSEDNLIDELYTPCLKWAERFDRGVGYFTTGWLTYNVAGLSDFASRGGKMRLITIPFFPRRTRTRLLELRTKMVAHSCASKQLSSKMLRYSNKKWKQIL